MTKERVEKRNRADALILQAERRLKEVALDFGMLFARNRCQRIETSALGLREHLAQDSDREIDQFVADLQAELSELNREVREYYSEDEEYDKFCSIRSVFTEEREREPPSEDSDDNTGGSPPIPSPLRPGPKPGTNDSAELPPIDH